MKPRVNARPAAAARRAEAPIPKRPAERPELARRADRGAYHVYDLRLPSSGINRQRGNVLAARWFRKPAGTTRGTVIVLPIWGRSNYPPDVVTRRILRSGELDVVRVLEHASIFDWQAMRDAPTPDAFLTALEASAASMEATIKDLGSLVRWLAHQDVGRRPIRIVGFSISAIVGAYLLGTEPALSGGALVMGGGGLDGIFKNCEKRSGRVREALIERFDIDRDRFGDLIADELRRFDPVPVAPNVDPRTVLYVDASADDCIPRENRESLWVALSRPERIQLHTRHRRAFLAMTPLRGHWLTRRIHEFLHRPTFSEGPPVTPVVATAGPG